MKISQDYKELIQIQRFKTLKNNNGLNLLKETISDFMSCNVHIITKPIKSVKELYNIDLQENPSRGCYPIDGDNNKFLIYARIIEENTLISGIGILLEGINIIQHKKFLNKLEGALSGELSHSFLNYFDDALARFGDNLILHAMSNYCIAGYMDHRVFYHLIEYFLKLKNTTFESNSFSTGLIITKSYFAYKEANKRSGDIFSLETKQKICDTLKVNRRFWYLADGKHSFFVADQNLVIKNLFVVGKDYDQLDYLDNNSLRLTLKGGDILLKIENEKQFSIINSDGVEFLCLENNWRLRDYNIIKSTIGTIINNNSIIDKLLFFILHCSKNSISSVIWIPNDLDKIGEHIKEGTLNKLITESISIIDNRFTNHIIRYLSSDGATIIDKDGFLQYYGSIVDMKEHTIKGVKGTGESASQVLSSNGLSIKISQDGTIKLFLQGNIKPITI